MDNSNNNQPRPISQPPQMPVASQPPTQPQPIPPQPGIPYQMPPKKKMSKGAIWGIIGGSIGLIILIVGIVLAVIFLGGPSKADYKNAQEKLNSAISAYNEASSAFSYISTSESRSSLESTRAKITKVKSEINTTLTDLGKTKAVTNDKDIREKYDKLKGRLEKFNNAADMLEEVYGKLLPPILDYTDASSSYNTSQLASSVKKIRQELESAEFKNDSNKKFVKDFTEQLKKMEEMLPKVIEMRSDYSKYSASYMNEFYGISTKIANIARDWQKDIQKIAEESELRDDLNGLESALVDKINK